MEEADRLADRIVVIDAGLVVTAGSADELKDRMGADVLEVRLADDSHLDVAVFLLDGLGTAPPRVDASGRRIAMPTRTGLCTLVAAARRLDDAGVRLAESAQLAGLLPIIPLIFTSSAFLPISSMPTWLQGFATVQPVTVVVNAVRAPLIGEPAFHWPWQAITWTIGILVVFFVLAARRYRQP
jgi:hypothetical protein